MQSFSSPNPVGTLSAEVRQLLDVATEAKISLLGPSKDSHFLRSLIDNFNADFSDNGGDHSDSSGFDSDFFETSGTIVDTKRTGSPPLSLPDSFENEMPSNVQPKSNKDGKSAADQLLSRLQSINRIREQQASERQQVLILRDAEEKHQLELSRLKKVLEDRNLAFETLVYTVFLFFSNISICQLNTMFYAR